MTQKISKALTKETLAPIDKIINSISQNSIAQKSISVQCGDESVEISVKTSLTPSDKMEFIKYSIPTLFINDTYNPYFKEDLFKMATFQYLTDIDIENLPQDEAMLLIHNDDIVQKVINAIPFDLMSELRYLVNDYVEFKKQELLNSQKAELQNALDKLEDCTNAFIEMAKDFKDLDLKEISQTMNKLGNLKEKEIVKAITNNLK